MRKLQSRDVEGQLDLPLVPDRFVEVRQTQLALAHRELGLSHLLALARDLAAQLPGRIKFIAGIEGESFESGTTLVAIEEDELLAEIGPVRAELTAFQTEPA